MKLKAITARKILNSRGQWTVEAGVVFDDGSYGVASCPEGASKGIREAKAVDARTAVRHIHETISPAFSHWGSLDQQEIDNRLRELDGTPDKSNLGGNTLLAVSLAFTKAISKHFGIPLWKHIRNIAQLREVRKPKLLMNFINGGMHAGNNLEFQEYIVIPQEETIRESVELGALFYNHLKSFLLDTNGPSSINVGDEGGFAPTLNDPMDPFDLFDRVAHVLGVKGHIRYGLDAAGTNVSYDFEKRTEYYRQMKDHYNLLYLEDPYHEDDFASHAELLKGVKGDVDIVGDDLTVTNPREIIKAHSKEAVSGVIIKANQIGTISETLDAVHTARNFGMNVYVSHRSGDTNDVWEADLAWGVGADGMKIGSPARGERVAKYNRLLEIEQFEENK